jgi:acetyl esterase/lipase
VKIARRTLLATGLALPAAAHAGALADPPVERFPVWPRAAPGGEGLVVRDEVVKRSPTGGEDDIAWPHVATPMLTVVPAARPNGAAVLICPGGGYARVATGRLGSGIARMFAARGITAFELLYRLPHDGWAAGPDAPLQDAQRAMRLIRARGGKWGVDPARVAVTGFSAGGHLAARLASRSALHTYDPVDAADSQSPRPTVAGLFFPVITLGPDAHAQSRRELLGADTSEARIKRFSAEDALPADMPPTFLAHAANDPSVPHANSIRMFTALQQAKIPSELMIFELGGHGLPLVRPDGTPHPWPELFLTFAGRHGL